LILIVNSNSLNIKALHLPLFPRRVRLPSMNANSKLSIAVIGVGNLGQHHARLLHECDQAHLVAIVDCVEERARTLGDQLQIPFVMDYREVLDQVDAVSIVTPTVTHHEIAKTALQAGKHTIIEKPITSSVEEADELIELAKQKNLILQVGHIERFNAAVLALDQYLSEPRFVESHRLGPPALQVQDVGVVLDLMIHDLDLILALVNSPVASIEAVGIPIITEMEDIANARITFESGCVANVTVSRVSDRKMRKIRFFQKDAYLSLDCLDQEILICQKNEGNIERKLHKMEGHNALLEELRHFIDCCKSGKRPLVSGEEARAALELAIKITNMIAKNPLNIEM
jgi:predicted dehydrogenase